VQENGQVNQNISYVLSSFYSVYYTAEKSNGLIPKTYFKLTTII